MRKAKLIVMGVALAGLLAGCSTLQKVDKVEKSNLRNVCIVEHKAVRGEVLEAIQEVLISRGIKTKVVQGSYENKDNMWVPTYKINDVKSCDGVLFYVANWKWDVTMYMHFANIWMTTPDANPTRLGGASYDARASLNKFIDARQKILELTRELLGG
jgi:hypothetical protein